MDKIVCKRCIMDNVGDEKITFDKNGICNYCNYAISRMDTVYFPNKIGELKLRNMINFLKKEGRNKRYDCLMGISGGLDSSYLAYLGANIWGLRILVIHVDDGFDTEIARQNIETICKHPNITLIIEKPNSKEYCDVIRSFILSGVPSITIPQDNILQLYLNKYAKKHKIKYFLSGSNFSLESILQRGNTHNASDAIHIKDIHKKFGSVDLMDMEFMNLFERYIGQKYIDRIVTLRPLDFIDYNKERALKELNDIGFNYYGGKHYESIFTKFAQVYYLPNKFNVDKRKSHLSSLIISGQLSREEALSEMKKPLYDEKSIDLEIEYILNKVGIDRKDFDLLMHTEGVPHSFYKMSILSKFSNIARKFRKILAD